MADGKFLKLNRTIQSGYVRVKNNAPGSPVVLRKWDRLVATEKPRSYQRTGKDTGVV